jgi:hypothetical protein
MCLPSLTENVEPAYIDLTEGVEPCQILEARDERRRLGRRVQDQHLAQRSHVPPLPLLLLVANDCPLPRILVLVVLHGFHCATTCQAEKFQDSAQRKVGLIS